MATWETLPDGCTRRRRGRGARRSTPSFAATRSTAITEAKRPPVRDWLIVRRARVDRRGEQGLGPALAAGRRPRARPGPTPVAPGRDRRRRILAGARDAASRSPGSIPTSAGRVARQRLATVLSTWPAERGWTTNGAAERRLPRPARSRRRSGGARQRRAADPPRIRRAERRQAMPGGARRRPCRSSCDKCQCPLIYGDRRSRSLRRSLPLVRVTHESS